ncbi:MAG: NADH-quinone oxidoreductase subunit A [Chloroflexi bacterium]|nr:NADH-quinone oxidoreductase subunit A [Chloroflexota bacterium]
MPTAYLPLLVLQALAVGFTALILAVSFLLGPRRPESHRMVPYESGIRPVQDARRRFPVKFTLVAMLFIVFDVEAVFFYPWAVTYRQLKLFGLIEMLIFVAILLVGYVYIWKRGALEWE